MSVFIAPELRLRAFRPLDSSAVDLPLDAISDVQSTRSLSGGSVSLRLHGMGRAQLQDSVVRLRELLPDETVVALSVRRRPGEPWRQLNMGFVRGWQQRIDASGKVTWSPQIQSLDMKLTEQELFIDLQDSTQTSDTKSRSGLTIVKAITGVSRVVRNMRDIPLLAQTVWNELIVDLLNQPVANGQPVLWGGRSLLAPAGSGCGLLGFYPFKGAGYTSGMLHTLQLMNGIRFGASPNFYQVLLSLITPPLYELFFDPLEGEGQLGDGVTYTVKPDSSALVMRKTPFDQLFDEQGLYRELRKVPEIMNATSVQVESIREDLFTGVHVGPGILDTASATLVSPPTRNELMSSIYGQRIMRIKLSGTGFPKGSGDGERQSLRQSLAEIQNRLYEIFCGGPDGQTAPLRNTTGTVSAAFDFYRVGTQVRLPALAGESPGRTVRRWWSRWKRERQPDQLQDYGEYGYVASVTDTFSIESRQAKSEIQLRWIDRLQ